jgi:hypothetical protein
VAILGASHVICTDGKPSVVQLAKDNLQHVAKELGGGGGTSSSSTSSSLTTTTTIHNCEVVVQKYWWGDDSLKEYADCDVVLVADCVLPKLWKIPKVPTTTESATDR